MTDGPLKNLKLGSCWQRFADAVLNPAVLPTECTRLASHALLQDLMTNNNRPVLQALYEVQRQPQLGFDPFSRIAAIFDDSKKDPVLDTLQKQLQSRMENHTSMEEAYAQAMNATREEKIGEIGNRIDEELLHARDTNKMGRGAYQLARSRVDVAFEGIDRQRFCDVIRLGNRNAFKAARKKGLDEGPSLL